MERVASVGSFCVSIIFRDMVATARYHDGSTMVSDCIFALASAKLQSDTVFHSARRIRGHAGRRRGGLSLFPLLFLQPQRLDQWGEQFLLVLHARGVVGHAQR